MSPPAHYALRRKITSLILLLCLLVVGLRSAHAASGLLLYTRDSASYVTAVQYEVCTSGTAHLTSVKVKGAKEATQVRSDGIIANIPYPTLFSPATQGDASKWIGMTEVLAARYPQHARILQSVGDLWRKSLEASQAAQVPERASPVPSTAPPKSNGIQAPKSEIAVLHTKSGQTFKKVKITRFDEGKVVFNHADGMARVALTDIGDMSSMPADARQVIEKAKVAAEEVKMQAEAERILQLERERVVQQAEADRLAKEKLEQERLAKLQQESQNAKNKRMQDDIATIEKHLHDNRTASGNTDHVSPQGVRGDTASIGYRGPVVHGFWIGMDCSDFLNNLKKIYSEEVIVEGPVSGFGRGWSVAGLVRNDEAFVPIIAFAPIVNKERAGQMFRSNGPEQSFAPAHISMSSLSPNGQVIAITFYPGILRRLFPGVPTTSFDDFCQSFIDGYKIPKLSGKTVNQTYGGRVVDSTKVMTYESPEGWKISLKSSGDEVYSVTIFATPMEIEKGFGR